MSVVDEIKDRIDIADFIGRHVHLQKSGRSLKGLCPFHTEKTPSFFVFPENQRWHCFGCGKGGDIFSFVMDYEGLDFRTALEELGRQAGVEIRPLTPEQVKEQSEAEHLRALLNVTADYYHHLLLTAPQAAHCREYLKKRGFTRETIDTFRLGYALESWDAARTYLRGKGYSIEDQIKAGMLVERDQGGTYDRFRNRVIIPICDRRGQVIAFGGRVLIPDDQPKYLNSPQTSLFDKSKVLFGYHLASRAIHDHDEVIIVEGYMDVMIPYQAGYKNVVAPMGTALTEAHLKQLQRLTKRFILALDPDAAGIHAMMRGLEVARETLEREWQPVFDPRGLIGYEGRLKVDIRVVNMPEGKDPDEVILEAPKKWEDLLQQSQPVVRFYFQQLLQQQDPHEPKGKARIVDAMLPLLGDISNNVEREAYAQEIALRLGLDARSLLDRLRVRDRAQAIRRQAAVSTAPKQLLDRDLESHVLSILMCYPESLHRVNTHLHEAGLRTLNENDFSTTYRLIWSAWMEMSEHPELELEDLLPMEIVEQVQAWVATPLPDTTQDELERDVVRTILRLRERQLKGMMGNLLGLVTEAQFEGDRVGRQYADMVKDLSQKLLHVQHALAR